MQDFTSIFGIVFPAVLAAGVGVAGLVVAGRRAAASRRHASQAAERDQRAHDEQAQLDRFLAQERLRAELEHQRDLAAHSRSQERITETYLLLLATLDAWLDWMGCLDDPAARETGGVPAPAAGDVMTARL